MTSLEVVSLLFARWSENGIRYCHWKSNQHLPEAVAGETDLDILVDETQARHCESVLKNLGFKKVLSPPWAQYPYAHDWIGFDKKTGSLCHVHLHYRLVLGKKYVKDIRLPLESWVLDNTRLQDNVPVPEYERELILLIIRIVLKTSLLSTHMPKNIRWELDWLIKNSDEKKIRSAAREMKLDINFDLFIAFIERYADDTLSKAYFWRVKRQLRPVFLNCRSMSDIERWKRVFWYIPYARSRALIKLKRRKRLPGHGLCFAIVGCDGSGKTTLAQDLKKWLKWKMDVRHIYLGIPKTFPARHTHITYKLLFTVLYKIVPVAKAPLSFIERWIDVAWWLFVARRRRRLYKKAIRLRKKGYIVIAERFPLQEFWSMERPMDGPRIEKRSGWLSAMVYNYERSLYRSIYLPDTVCVLRASADTLHARKPNTNLQQLQMKSKAVNELPTSSKYFFVNVEEVYNDVLLAVKKLLWEGI